MEKQHTLSFEQLPQAVSKLLSDMADLRTLISTDRAYPPTPTSKAEAIGINDACRILGKAKSTIYRIANTGKIPCYKRGNKLYLFENELIEHIKQGHRKTITEIQSEIGDGK